jgi:hypothetical protein
MHGARRLTATRQKPMMIVKCSYWLSGMAAMALVAMAVARAAA